MSDKKKDTTEMNFEDLQDVDGGYIVYDGKKNGDKCYSVIDAQGNQVASGYSKKTAQYFANHTNLSPEEISRSELERIKFSGDTAIGGRGKK